MQTKEMILIDKGIKIGIKEGIKEGKIIKEVEMLKEFKVDREIIISRLKKEYDMTEEEIERYL